MLQHELEVLIQSEIPLLVIESTEENQVVELLLQLRHSYQRPLFKWTLTEGIRRLDQPMPAQKLFSQPTEALQHIKSVSNPGVYIMADLHPFMDEPMHIRLLKDIALNYETLGHRVILLSHAFEVPVELRKLSARLEISLPGRNEIERIVREEAQNWLKRSGARVQASQENLQLLVSNLTGLTRTDARRLARNAIFDDGAITASDIPEVNRAKYKLLSEQDNLHFEYDTAQFSEVAGFRRLKQWLDERKVFFNGDASSLPDTPAPKGMLLLGVQGCGKSLAAKAVAGSWHAPLLRLDFGALYNKYYGESEKNLREALQTAEVMAPCVLWLDEIEKGISADGGESSGPASRMLGTLLTWMAEKKAPVFLVATANNIQALPPELVRKGRFDEIFFVDLPDEEIRFKVFDIHLKRQKADPAAFDFARLVEASEGFSGAEIEQAVVSAFYTAHAQESELNQAILLAELRKTQPLSVVMAEQIAELRAWASQRTVPCD
ncbi:AAA family ATPase [Neptuniibacter halophilus]|uniref:AAA family ATPase n=1 Tax=Neptuniibacter halophilus TaxID=651666 RepID=UPI0025725DEB|nr:AAA family ATPase [Neptuniibacter halophilus]